MRVLRVAEFVFVSAALLTAAEIRPSGSDGLTVHEWGTFTSVAGEDGAAIEWDTLGCKSDLPRFVNDFGYRGFKWRLRGTVRMETPVLYFYTSSALTAHVRVAFPQGLITEWYPQAEYQVFQKNWDNGSMRRLPSNLNGIDTSMRSLTGAIEWPNIHVEPGSIPVLPVEPDASRYYAARQTDAAPVTIGGQQEKFLFYRGAGNFPVPLSARVAGNGQVTVQNAATGSVPVVILFENRQGLIGYRLSGPVEDSLTFDAPALNSTFAQLRQDLEAALIAQGLFEKEARAMVDTWQDSWFEEGTRLIYLLPSRTVDAMLPLHVDPAPAETTRVFVGRIELITPDTQRAVQLAIAKSDWTTLDRYSRFLDPILNRIYAGDDSRARAIERFYRQSRSCR